MIKAIRVNAPGHTAQVGEYWSAVGELKKMPWGVEPKNWYLWTTVDEIRRYDEP